MPIGWTKSLSAFLLPLHDLEASLPLETALIPDIGSGMSLAGLSNERASTYNA